MNHRKILSRALRLSDRFTLVSFIAILSVNLTLAQPITIDRSVYADRLRAMWLGECIANWTGIQTEGRRTEAPFFTDENWSTYGFILTQDPWLADDDTDIEYVYLHLLTENGVTTLTPDMIRDGWMRHINGWIWVSNARARSMFNEGVLPPATSLLNANELAIQIDAQLTTEVFGALAPGMPQKALQMAYLPILTTATSHAAHAAQFHVLLYSLACLVDTSMSGREQALWLINEARRYIPTTSKVADIIDFVRADFLANPDLDDWESTRDKIYDRYHLHAVDNGFRYAGWTESSVNLATGVMCLLYGEMDYRKTVRIGALSGWDSDNPTATMGGLIGLIYGYERLVTEFPEVSVFSDRYRVYRTREALPDYLPSDGYAEDTFTMMADRMLAIIDKVVSEGGGSVESDAWILPGHEQTGVQENPLYELMQSSANNRVPGEGGTVQAQSSVGGTSLSAIADGFEHDFSGREWFGDAPEYLSDVTDSAMISVTYSEPVQVHTVRYIEGTKLGGLVSAEIRFYQEGTWLTPPVGVVQTKILDPFQKLQVVDFILDTLQLAEGIKITGPVCGQLNILELDAFSAPPRQYGNLPPFVNPGDVIPGEIRLYQNYPNPFNLSTFISFRIPNTQHVHLSIYDILGREVIRLLDEVVHPGYKCLVWTGKNSSGLQLPSGMYIARLETPMYHESILMLLVK